MSDIQEIHELVFAMEGDLTELETAVLALGSAIQAFAEMAEDGSGPLDRDVADVIASKLRHDHKSLQQKYDRLFDLTKHHRRAA